MIAQGIVGPPECCVVTGYEDGCFQPYITVVRDPATRRFRMWYGVPAEPGRGSL